MASFRLRSDLTVCIGTTARGPKVAVSVGTNRASHANAVLLQQKVRLFLEQLIDKGFGCRVHAECREQTLAKDVRESDG